MGDGGIPPGGTPDVVRRAGERDAPTVVFVHGSLDAGASFGRVLRRLPEYPCVTYDRRGYRSSRHLRFGPDPLGDHVADLAAIVGAGPAVVVGHSFGGLVGLCAAAAGTPGGIRALAAYEAPFPWSSPVPRDARTRARDPGADPAAVVERFYGRVVGPGSWERLKPEARAERLADGPALAADLAVLGRAEVPVDLHSIEVPVVIGCGGDSDERHRRTAAWLESRAADGRLVVVPGAGHGAHLSHPDAFADLVRAAVRAGGW